MNHFELYKIPLSFLPDLTSVKKQFYVLSRAYHPDFFGAASAFEKEEALAISAQINTAFRIFQDKDATIKYILQLKGLLEEEEKYNLPSHFLMEVMELDHSDEAAKKLVETALIQFQHTIYEPVESIISNYQESTSSEKELLQIKDYYFKKKYLDRIGKQLLSNK